MPNSILNSKKSKRLKLSRLLKRFKKDQDGVTAIEFAMLGLPFFLILTSILEVSIFFFAGQYLDNSVDQVARRVRVGDIKSNMTQSQFKQEVCDEAALMFKCDKIKVDLKVVATYEQLGDDTPAPADGKLEDSQYTYDTLDKEKIVQLTVHYEWPILTNFVAKHWANLDDGALMSSAAAFRTEAY